MNELINSHQRTFSIFQKRRSGISVDSNLNQCHRKIQMLNQTINRMFDQNRYNFIELENLKPSRPMKVRSLSKQLDVTNNSILPSLPTSTKNKHRPKQQTECLYTSEDATRVVPIPKQQLNSTSVSPFPHYLNSNYFNRLATLRSQIILFIFNIHYKLQFTHDSFHLTVHIFDTHIYKFLQNLYSEVTDTQIYNLMKQVIIAAFYIVVKLENINIKLETMLFLTQSSIAKQSILDIEQVIINSTPSFNQVTSYSILKQLFEYCSNPFRKMSIYLIDLTLLDLNLSEKLPTLVAVSVFKLTESIQKEKQNQKNQLLIRILRQTNNEDIENCINKLKELYQKNQGKNPNLITQKYQQEHIKWKYVR